TGTDTAMETADVVLMADNIEKLPYTMNLSRKAITIIKQNIWFALLIKLAALILIFPGWLKLWMAVLSDTGAAIIVILYAFRLLEYKEYLLIFHKLNLDYERFILHYMYF